MAIQLVGYATAAKVGQGAAAAASTISLSSGLAGGTRDHAEAGDLVLAFFASGSTVDRTLAITDGTTDYALIGSELYANSSYDSNLRVAYKFMGGTPDAAVSFGPTGNASDAGAMQVRVYSGVDPSSPLDVAALTATGTGSLLANPPAITPATTDAVIVAVGAAANGSVGNFSSSNLDSFTQVPSIDTNSAALGVGEKAWTGGSFDPAAYANSFGSAPTGSWTALTIALRPTTGGGGSVVNPAVGHAVYTGYAPTVARTANQSVAPAAGRLTYAGKVPTVVQNAIVAPATGHLTYTGYTPTVAQSANVNVSPGTGHLIYTGYVPTIEQPHVVAPVTGHLVYTGYVPTVTQAANQTVAPATGHLVYAGYAPTVERTANQWVAPVTGHLTYTGYAPTIVQTGGNLVQPATGHLVYQGYAPSVTQSGGGGGDQFRVGGETVQALFQTDKIAFPWDVRMKTNT